MAYYYFDTFAQKVANTYNNVYVCVCMYQIACVVLIGSDASFRATS